jgi:hypothetical protein
VAITPDRCPNRDIHEVAVKTVCSQCGWTPLRAHTFASRKTFVDGSWRTIDQAGTIGERCTAPTAEERSRWAAEDASVTDARTRFPAIAEAPPPGTRVYKVVTQRDQFFRGEFDPLKLTELMNSLALEGWRVVAITTADVSTFAGTFWSGRGAREELIVFLEKTVE